MKRFVTIVVSAAAALVLLCAAVYAEPEQGTLGKNTQAGTSGKSLTVGDPISAASGGYSFTLPLLNLGGPMGLDFTLLYDQSIDNFSVIGGSGFPVGNSHLWWSPAATGNFFITYGGDMNTVHLPDGSTVNFVKNGTGDFVLYENSDEYPSNGSATRYVMKETADYIYLLDPSAERIYIFKKTTCTCSSPYKINPVRYVLDRNGNQLVYEYNATEFDGDCELLKIHDTLGRSLNFGFTDLGGGRVLQSVTDQAVRKITFTYEQNAADNNNSTVLRSVTDPMNQACTFYYQTVSGGGNVYTGNIAKVKNPLGNIPYQNTFVYSAVTLSGFAPMEAARVSEQKDAYGNATAMTYTPDAYKTTVSYPDGNQEIYEHAGAHTPPSGLTDGTGKNAGFTMNDRNQTTSVTDRRGDTIHFTYHPETGNPASVTNAMGKTTSYTYTAQDQAFTNPANGETVTFTFYNLTRITHADGSVTDMTHDARGNLLTLEDPAGGEWTYTYNERGQVLTVTNPNGGVVSSTYNADGTLASKRDSDTLETTYEYDALKRPVKITYPDDATVAIAYNLNDQIVSITDAESRTTRHEYDANGNRIKTTDAAGKPTEYTYDLMDRLARVTNRLNGARSMAYDSRDRLASVTDPNRLKTEYAYDARGWPIGVTVDGKTWQTAYDAEGIVVSRTTPMGRQTRYASDSLGRMIAVTDPLNERAELAYDDMGRLAATTDPLGRVTARSYDQRGLLTGMILPNGATAAYDFNASGQLQQITDLNGTRWRFAYTPAGRLQSMTDPLDRGMTQTYDTRGRLAVTTWPDASTLTRSYDTSGDLVRQAYTGGLVQTYTYDALHRMTAADDVAFEYDAEGRIMASVQSGRRFTAAYDAGGRLITVGYNDDALTVTYAYNARGLLAGVSDSRGASVTFIYDDDNRFTGLNRSNGVNGVYDHDAAGRSVRLREGGFADLQLTRNAVGDIISANLTLPLDPTAALASTTTSLTYDSASQIQDADYAHDERGRMTAMPGYTFTWDAASRLTGINGIALEYNGLNNMIRRIEGGEITKFFYHQAIVSTPIVAEIGGSGTALRYYVWSPAGHLLWCYDETRQGALFFYHFDQTGSTLALTDAAGAVTDTYAYEPFGRLLARTGASIQPFTFLGRLGVRQEGAAGRIYHARARYYDALTGRFISRDPLWPNGIDPRAINPYQYAGNSPLTYTDADGTSALLASVQWDELNAEIAAARSRSYALSAASHFVRYRLAPTIDVTMEDHLRRGGLYVALSLDGPHYTDRWINPEEYDERVREFKKMQREAKEELKKLEAHMEYKSREAMRIHQTKLAEIDAIEAEYDRTWDTIRGLMRKRADLARKMRMAGVGDEFFSKHALPKKVGHIRAELIGKSKIPDTYVLPYTEVLHGYSIIDYTDYNNLNPD